MNLVRHSKTAEKLPPGELIASPKRINEVLVVIQSESSQSRSGAGFLELENSNTSDAQIVLRSKRHQSNNHIQEEEDSIDDQTREKI
jgi:hypothetical protein